MIVEMRPELAPKAVERIKLLARERVYDGLQFHRVIEASSPKPATRTTRTAVGAGIRTSSRSSRSRSA
jgi:cyclophilin family peptidyl-prolyl cis-trans isomerase